ncbi:histidinol-phosphate transaminase [Amycolatopsis acidiphila]|uniref:Aromatic amino acid aminotransferase n=1 Tax=Amycolatopsis acidiphila TaxID=715473 RepID=A0A558AMY4_9PSEU|nr:histidinol-phosphate transaminase [Amycolatopsis acidiphila]TVT25590.1 histidinol-phosphate transaminase [Amycolatopsis acidiphila]UIJ60342.1 histidinol-phosphate transaminase [Amycolatopsis acidiphila]GHG90596.1 putative phenylalanine aminotransferase [Amycolatopsis acidiphila]
MPVQPRVDLDTLPDYVAGRSVPGAIKLSSNETPGGPLPSVAAAIAKATTDLNRYPDPGVGKLAARLAEKLGLPAGQIAVGCGSVALCHQLMHAMCAPGDDAVFAWRSFETYPIATQIACANPVKVPLDSTHTHDLDAMADAITPNTRVIMVCNPNNPTGTANRRAELDRFLDRVPSDVLVVLDEAYREFVTDPDVPDGVDYVRTRDNVAVLRTFSKAYGLAGLRVGYFAGPPQIAAALRKVYVPFSVNSLAQTAAMACLDAEDELLARCETIVAERERVRNELIEAGYEVPDTQANFVWLPLGDDAVDFSEHTLANKVVVRAFAGSGVRVTISHSEENDLFLHAARSYRRTS